MADSLNQYLKARQKLISRSLEYHLKKNRSVSPFLNKAVNYSVFGGGKRIRPILTLAINDLLNGSKERALIPACAIEMIHCSSLVHDDLPSMDNDDYRRGRLTCHKKFGEAYAILVGDSLFIDAFFVLSQYPDPAKARRLVQLIAEASGGRGMVGGQVVDKLFEGKEMEFPTLNLIHVNKTGRLFAASCIAGAISAGASRAQERRIRRFGEYIGVAFQVVDDIMDGDGYLNFMSESEARKEADQLTQKALAELKPFGKKAARLKELVFFLEKRKK